MKNVRYFSICKKRNGRILLSLTTLIEYKCNRNHIYVEIFYSKYKYYLNNVYLIILLNNKFK